MKIPIIFAIVLLFSVTAYNPHEGCSHVKHPEPTLMDVQEEFLSAKSRVMATATYPQIRMAADYTNLLQGSDTFKSYVQNSLVPLVMTYYQNALQVKQPLTAPIKASTSTLCGYTTPSVLLSGVNADFFVMVSSTNDSTSNWVASAGACTLSSTTKRPVIATMLFNLYYTAAPAGDPLIHEKNMYLTMHEMLHALGFTQSSFANFIDANGTTLTGQLKTATLNGSTRLVLDVEPLTTMLRTYYGCSTLPGAFLENDGGSGTAGSHFERRHFLYEVMTSGVIQGLRISPFSLAVMEGSGWYLPNYTYADPFFAGKGEGCGYLYTACNSSDILNYDEFCNATTDTRGCAAVGIAGGVCSADSRSDGCQYYIPVISYDCQSPGASSYARFPSKEVYSRTGNSMCFNGNMSTLKSSTDTSMCFQYVCTGSGLNTAVMVLVGSTYYTCSKEGNISVSGYYGYIYCPDPLTFCSTAGQTTCPRNCMGRGTCVNNQCVCKTGFSGIDCAMDAYTG